jgi:hypothetical protein
MSDFKTRLLEERDQLKEKLEKLDTFVDGDIFPTILELQRELLLVQLYHMSEYLYILDERLEDLDKN